MEYKLPPFFECCLTFVGFSEEEKAHMEETTIEQGKDKNLVANNSFFSIRTCIIRPNLFNKFVLKESMSCMYVH